MFYEKYNLLFFAVISGLYLLVVVQVCGASSKTVNFIIICIIA